MNGEVENDSKKRRLPVWMLGVSAADNKTTKSQNGQVNDKEEVIQNSRIGVEVVESKASKSRARRLALREKQADLLCNNDALEEEDSGFVVKRKKAKRKGKGEEKDVIFSGSDIEKDGVEKRKRGRGVRNVGKSSRVRREVEKLGVECSDDIAVASPDEDAEDLTVDDLLTMAKEFVNDEGVMEQEQPVDGIVMVTERKSATSSLFENEPQGVPETSRILTMPKETASCLNPSGNLTSRKTVVNASRTGDPAQDMLNLFLGPWLTIPVQEEKKAEVITDDMVFAYKLRQQSQEIVLGDVPIPLAKKKISLKDKVAMFLD